jgi:hypothetical protein
MEIFKVLSISVAIAFGIAMSAALLLHWFLTPLEAWRQKRLARISHVASHGARAAH